MTRLIKKYKNRRLYDTEISAYFTLEQLEQYVTEGLDFKVVDAASEQDISSQVLLQLLVEMESGATQFLSPLLLKQMIIMSRHPMHKTMKSALEQMMSGLSQNLEQGKDFQKAGQAWTEQMSQMMKQWQGLFNNENK